MAASGRIDELRKRYDENPRRFFAPLANEYRKAGDLEMAIDLCRMHLAEVPANLNGQIVFGQALYDAGSLDDARAAFEASIALDPENLIALRHLGDIAREQGDIPNARQWYRRVLDADRRNEDVLAIMDELAALEAGGATAASAAAAADEAAGVGTIELDEPPMRAPAPSRPSIMSLIGSAAPSDSREIPSVEAPAEPELSVVETAVAESTTVDPASAVETVEVETIEVEPVEVEPVEVEAVVEAVAIEVPEPEPVEPEAPDVDAIDFGMVDPHQSAATHEPDLAPDSSFGFDVDLGAASDIPVATSVGDTGDFGLVEIVDDAPFRETEEVKPPEVETAADSLIGHIDLHEPIDLDTFGAAAEETVESSAVADEPPAPAKLTLVRSDDVDDTIDLVDDDLPEITPPPEPPATMPRRSTPVVFNFDLSVEDGARSPTPMAMASVADETPDVSIDIDEPIDEPIDDTIDDTIVDTIDESIDDTIVETIDASVDEPDAEFVEGLVAEPVLAAEPVEPIEPTEPDEEDIREMPTPIIQPAVEAFATETMAELYVKQGLRHEAIAVYKQLIDAKPNDAGLKQRLAEIEDDGHVPAGSSARSFFGALSRRSPKGRTSGETKLPVGAPPRGSLDKLFGGASVARHDEHAAESLSTAFGSAPASPEESALDRMFNTGPARPPGR